MSTREKAIVGFLASTIFLIIYGMAQNITW